MHVLLSAEHSEAELLSELRQSFVGARVVHPRLLETEFGIVAGQRLPQLVFCRQLLPNARRIQAASIKVWAIQLFEAVAGVLPDAQPWSLHIEPQYGLRTAQRMGARAWYSNLRAGTAKGRVRNDCSIEISRPALRSVQAEAGLQRCRLIRETLTSMLYKRRRHLLRQLRRDPVWFTPKDSLVQLLLTDPENGFISVAPAPMPCEQRHVLSPFPRGEVAATCDKTAPSRAFAKLVEAELRMGERIRTGEVCVDLGASPGSWTYLAVKRGAQVIAVDRSILREDLMRNGQVKFQTGDAFGFKPGQPVDWLLCDVVAPQERTAELLLEWLRRRWCRRFVVTLKLKGSPRTDVLARLKRELPPLTREFFLARLCANKKEVCAFGMAA